MRSILILLAGWFIGAGCGLQAAYWTARKYAWVKDDFTVMLLALIIGINGIGIGIVLLVWLWRQRHSATCDNITPPIQ